jgi:hypothetical protein
MVDHYFQTDNKVTAFEARDRWKGDFETGPPLHCDGGSAVVVKAGTKLDRTVTNLPVLWSYRRYYCLTEVSGRMHVGIHLQAFENAQSQALGTDV